MAKHQDGRTNEDLKRQQVRREGVQAKRNLEKKGSLKPTDPKHRKG